MRCYLSFVIGHLSIVIFFTKDTRRLLFVMGFVPLRRSLLVTPPTKDNGHAYKISDFFYKGQLTTLV